MSTSLRLPPSGRDYGVYQRVVVDGQNMKYTEVYLTVELALYFVVAKLPSENRLRAPAPKAAMSSWTGPTDPVHCSP